MEFIIGGAYQGKRAYVEQVYGISTELFLDGATCTLDIKQAVGIYHLHCFIYRLMKEAKNPMNICEKLILENPNLYIISDEIGYGIVPVDAMERSYREMCGRVCCMIAQRADCVHRVVCGVGSVIAGG